MIPATILLGQRPRKQRVTRWIAVSAAALAALVLWALGYFSNHLREVRRMRRLDRWL